MISTTYSKYAALQITLPNSESEQAAAEPRSISVAVDAQGRYAINYRVLEGRDPVYLAEELRHAANGNAEMVVEIYADALTSHQSVINVLEAARLAGLPRISFSAQTNKKQK